MKNSINIKKVLIGGFIAGMIINIIDTPNGALISGPAIIDFLKAHSIEPNPWIPAYFLPLHIVFGIMLVWLYAAFIPKFGEGKRNAIYATLAIMIPTRLFSLGFVVMGLLPLKLFLTLSASVIIGFLIGGIVGGWYYSRNNTKQIQHV
jgi:MFS family permease